MDVLIDKIYSWDYSFFNLLDRLSHYIDQENLKPTEPTEISLPLPLSLVLGLKACSTRMSVILSGFLDDKRVMPRNPYVGVIQEADLLVSFYFQLNVV